VAQAHRQRTLSGADVCAASPITPSVGDFVKTIITSPFLLFIRNNGGEGENSNAIFSKTSHQFFEKILPESVPIHI